MKLEQLLDFFPQERHRDLESLYGRYRREGDTDDVDGFVMHLHEEGLLSDDAMRDVLTLGEVSLSAPPDSRVDIPRLYPRHRVGAQLGKGAMGEVLIARDTDLKRTVALKRLLPKHVDKPALTERFFTEAQITAQLEHPGIVPIYGVERDKQGRLAYSMKLVRGRTLTDVITAAKGFYAAGQRPDAEHSLSARLEMFTQVCSAMAYAHRRAVIHRDLKPDNIMVGDYQDVLVMDWGLARPIGARARVTLGAVSEGTRPGSVVGSPAYMSPEQARGMTDELGPESDQCALGLILYELVTLQRALHGDSAFEVVLMASAGQRRPIAHAHGVKIPRGLVGIIEKATAYQPADRYESVEALAEDVRRFLRDEEVLAAPDSRVHKVQRWISHHRGLALAMGFGLVLMIFLVAGVMWWMNAAAMQRERDAALLREQQLTRVVGIVNEQAHEMDTRLYAYESAVTGLAYTAEQLLQEARPAPPTRKYIGAEYNDPATAPADVRRSQRYKDQLVSFAMDFGIAEGVERATIEPQMDRLAMLQPTFLKMTLRSHSEDATKLPDDEARTLIFDEGVPFIWTYVATEEGVIVGFPGSSIGYDADYDPRKMAWYEAGKGARGPVWDAAEPDEGGLGLLMTVVRGLYDRSDRFLGVAALDLTFNYFIEELLDPAELAKVGEAFLVDKNGKVVIRSSQKGRARSVTEYELVDFEHADVLAEARQRASGYRVIGDRKLGDTRLAVWSHLQATDYIYVIIGATDAMLAASGAVVE